ncbi:metalloproteinase inhibitor 2-like [Hippocampus comes]|uniref:Metalloproteinase inhibitor 2-like n=1 Tax=Hippocampus comes TaxID=109280 RepID=A0A3Q2YEU8_HIPCM|nr:PREDICTED: metalloproteinase inhibitor 2-like [Hippocampus comes]
MSWQNFVLALVLLCLWGFQEVAQACTCLPVHPQQVFCKADVVVIKAKVVGVTPGMHVEGTLTKYDIKQRKNFKGTEKLFDAIYTAPGSAACGVTLTKGTEYLLMGRLQSDGSLRISVCDFYQPWKALSAVQKSLLYRYEKGCDCMIKSCFSFPCCKTTPTECLWTFLPGKMGYDEQAQNFACIKKNDVCFWYRAAFIPRRG